MSYRDPAILPSSPCCPRDGSVLTAVDDVVARLCCPRCHGEWMRRDQVVALASDVAVQTRFDAGEPIAAEYRGDGSKTLTCPDCRTAMRRYEYGEASRVPVDVCRQHGLWLDVGELSRLASYLRHYAQKVASDDVAGAMRGPRRDRDSHDLSPDIDPVDVLLSPELTIFEALIYWWRKR
jgi:Zn-finger nucleic acid-binding protein